ncbi:MAG: hypothetical protein H6573_34340 [Lewinellaceae bacterium]|nr:hypothetical protein [Lewinellaceae bacterium]
MGLFDYLKKDSSYNKDVEEKFLYRKKKEEEYQKDLKKYEKEYKKFEVKTNKHQEKYSNWLDKKKASLEKKHSSLNKTEIENLAGQMRPPFYKKGPVVPIKPHKPLWDQPNDPYSVDNS